jgi:UDP-4-amino-4,6-dideoxy-N-acetyl-beta-L-altrosamine transaminase
MIPYGKQDITQDDIDSVVKVLKSDFLTQGPVVPVFEDMIKNYCNVKYAFALNSATSALHIACLALGIQKGDIVWTSANTFVASANCALYCGASIDFIDINPETNNISLIDLENRLKQAKLLGNLPKVLIPVHLTGQSCEMKEIHKLSVQYGFKIIEDASHAIGGKYKNEPIGSCKYSDITVFSFHPVKIITTGEGGVATTKDKDLAQKINILRSHGITRDLSQMNESHGPWYYEQLELGFNYRMTDIHAALGISQIKKLDEFVSRRNEIAKVYDNELSNLPLKTPFCIREAYSSMHLYVIRLELEKIKFDHKKSFIKLREKDILVNLHYIPVYLHPFYQKLGFKRGYCPESEKYYSEAISIPMFPALSSCQQSEVIRALKEVL